MSIETIEGFLSDENGVPNAVHPGLSNVTANWHIGSLSTPIGSLKESFEKAVAAHLGASAYFSIIRKRLVREVSPKTAEHHDPKSFLLSGPTPILNEHFIQAITSKGFRNLNDALALSHLKAELSFDKRPINPYPGLLLTVRPLKLADVADGYIDPVLYPL